MFSRQAKRFVEITEENFDALMADADSDPDAT